ncbi:MAG: pyruvate dehydrogenase component [Burkholderiaceae bacterium]|nr:pyruvate dehydrogenase component [Burkholderiaceae bacterium]
MIEFTLPSLGADMDQGKLVQWKVEPGDPVKRGQIVAVIETSKAAVEVEIWHDGTVHELLVPPGETVPVGTVLATLLEPGEDAAGIKPGEPDASAAPDVQAPVAPAQAVAEVAAPAAVVPAAAFAAPAAGRARISPAARRRAEELGIVLESLTGSGPDGAVTLDDVEHAAQPAKPVDRQAEMRKAIAAAMGRSKREIPHYYLSETVPMQKAQAWLLAANESRPVTERLLMAALQLKAVALALKDFPDMNGFFADGGFRPSAAIHVGVAISLRQGGLIAPAIHDAAGKSLPQIMRDLMDLVQRARAGSLRGSEMSDPTITVTNLGEQGVEVVHGVIYPPQVALVGFGRMSERPWVENGEVRALPLVTASLAADHRVSDGHRGGLFLSAIGNFLQQPEKL